MTQTIEVDLGKILERIEQNLIDLKVGQASLLGKVETLQVEVQNIKEDVKEIKTEQKEIRNEVSGLYKWVIGTLIVAVIGVANIFLRFFDLLPKA